MTASLSLPLLTISQHFTGSTLRRIALVGIALFALGSLAVSLLLDNWTWFASSGAVITLSGNVDWFKVILRPVYRTMAIVVGSLIWAYGEGLGEWIFDVVSSLC